MNDKRTQPLTVEREDGRLVISIGIYMLARGIEASPDQRIAPYDEASRTFRPPRITDDDKFADAMVTALIDEEGDGTTVIHKLLDNTAANAIENGCEGVELGDEV